MNALVLFCCLLYMHETLLAVRLYSMVNSEYFATICLCTLFTYRMEMLSASSLLTVDIDTSWYLGLFWASKGISLTAFKATSPIFRQKHSLCQSKSIWLGEVKGQLMMQCLLKDWTRTFFLSWIMVSYLLSLCLLTGAACWLAEKNLWRYPHASLRRRAVPKFQYFASFWFCLLFAVLRNRMTDLRKAIWTHSIWLM